MARTQSADYDQRREAIIDKAAALFARRGFLGASINDLAHACGTSKSLIYHYYPSKEDILFAVVYSHVDALGDAAERVLSAHPDAASRLRELTRVFMRLSAGAPARHRVLLNELDHLTPDAKAKVVARQRRLISMVEDMLSELQPRLRSNRVQRRPVAMLYFGMINWTHTWYDPAGAIAPEQVADMVVGLVREGLDGVK